MAARSLGACKVGVVGGEVCWQLQQVACVCERGGVDSAVMCTCKVCEGRHNREAMHGCLSGGT